MYFPPIALIALMLLWSLMHIFAAVQGGLSGYSVGLAVGNILAPTVPAYLIALVVWFASKRSQFASSVTFTIIFLALAASSIVRNMSAPERLQKKAVSGTFSGSTEECTTLSKAWPILLGIEESTAREQKNVSAELQQLDAQINSSEFTDLSLLYKKETVTYRRLTLEKYRDLWKRLADFVKSPASSSQSKMKDAGIPDEGIRRATICIKGGLEAGLKKSAMKSGERYLALAEARQVETQAVVDMYSHLEKHWGNWEIQSGAPVFREDEVMDEYNAIVINIEKASAKAQSITAEAANSTE